MRLKSVFIGQYKNLRDFELNFDGTSFIDVFVGKNGSGKSNLFEALIEIFRHLVEFGGSGNTIGFDYSIAYTIEEKEVRFECRSGRLAISFDGQARRNMNGVPLPDNLLIYYSGHNNTVDNLIAHYATEFSERLKNAGPGENRWFLGIGSEYKSLLLMMLLLQPEDNPARKYVVGKLGIERLGIPIPGRDELTEPVIRITLERPEYARDKKQFDIEQNDETDRYWRAEGIVKQFLDDLTRCEVRLSERFTISEGYFASDERYVLHLSLDRLQTEFGERGALWLFRQFDNLKTLGMLAEISVPLKLKGGSDGNIQFFSDGQFQTVYIYAVVELFKDSNCLMLLDEPDAFLHPEWQFDFLKQVLEITEADATNNHLLLSSHSASTIMTASEDQIRLIEFNGEKVVVIRTSKAEIIRSLSAGLITFSETEARLNINHVLRKSSGAVLFCEGITDELILDTAWSKLYPAVKCPFDIQTAFDRIFLRNLFSRDDLKTNFPNRKMFALFDFDEAYDDWNGLKKSRDEVTDPLKGLTKQLEYAHHYAMLLPVPNVEHLKRQVLDNDGKPWGRGSDSHLPIELLFFREEWIGRWFTRRAACGGAEIIEFTGDKARFASNVVPRLPANEFELLRPVFEFIKANCTNP
jgi:predicted ATPase